MVKMIYRVRGPVSTAFCVRSAFPKLLESFERCWTLVIPNHLPFVTSRRNFASGSGQRFTMSERETLDVDGINGLIEAGVNHF
jgi:hypothetical protein